MRPSSAIARPESMRSSAKGMAADHGCRSTRRTAYTARPAISRTRPKTLFGLRLRAEQARSTSACDLSGAGDGRNGHKPAGKRDLKDDRGEIAIRIEQEADIFVGRLRS